MTTTNDSRKFRYLKWGERLPKWGGIYPIQGTSATKKYRKATKTGSNGYLFGVRFQYNQFGAK